LIATATVLLASTWFPPGGCRAELFTKPFFFLHLFSSSLLFSSLLLCCSAALLLRSAARLLGCSAAWLPDCSAARLLSCWAARLSFLAAQKNFSGVVCPSFSIHLPTQPSIYIFIFKF